ncbi:MAG: sporulation protein YabP [Angelakisella sp.]|jgi:sporulation protein YabP|nr:sporulation protein YabP [Angelakisella sp.]MCI9528076.1 sporulation protein YabP [Angelakisella sp.]
MENKQLAMPHSIIIEDRKNVSISGVTDVESFDEETVILMTDLGELVIKGFGLHISKIDVVSGDLALEGEIYSIGYSDTQAVGGGLLSRLFR